MAHAQQPHDFVAEVCRRVEHERTTTLDHGDAMLTPVGSGGGVHAAPAVGAMHPHILDPELSALSHRALGFLRRGRDDDGLDTSEDAPQIVIAASTLDSFRVRVDREHVITPVTQTLEHGVGTVLL